VAGKEEEVAGKEEEGEDKDGNLIKRGGELKRRAPKKVQPMKFMPSNEDADETVWSPRDKFKDFAQNNPTHSLSSLKYIQINFLKRHIRYGQCLQKDRKYNSFDYTLEDEHGWYYYHDDVPLTPTALKALKSLKYPPSFTLPPRHAEQQGDGSPVDMISDYLKEKLLENSMPKVYERNWTYKPPAGKEEGKEEPKEIGKELSLLTQEGKSVAPSTPTLTPKQLRKAVGLLNEGHFKTVLSLYRINQEEFFDLLLSHAKDGVVNEETLDVVLGEIQQMNEFYFVYHGDGELVAERTMNQQKQRLENEHTALLTSLIGRPSVN